MYLGFDMLAEGDKRNVPDYLSMMMQRVHASKNSKNGIRFQMTHGAKIHVGGEVWELTPQWRCSFAVVGAYPNFAWNASSSGFLQWGIYHQCHFGASIAWSVLEKIPLFDFSLAKIVFAYAFDDLHL